MIAETSDQTLNQLVDVPSEEPHRGQRGPDIPAKTSASSHWSPTPPQPQGQSSLHSFTLILKLLISLFLTTDIAYKPNLMRKITQALEQQTKEAHTEQ